jgi:hypothetical protein
MTLEIRGEGNVTGWEGRGRNASDGNQETPEAGIRLRLGAGWVWALTIVRGTKRSVIASDHLASHSGSAVVSRGTYVISSTTTD